MSASCLCATSSGSNEEDQNRNNCGPSNIMPCAAVPTIDRVVCYYAIRRCLHLAGPAIFWNWKSEDVEGFLLKEKQRSKGESQPEEDTTHKEQSDEKELEYQAFDNLLDAIGYIGCPADGLNATTVGACASTESSKEITGEGLENRTTSSSTSRPDVESSSHSDSAAKGTETLTSRPASAVKNAVGTSATNNDSEKPFSNNGQLAKRPRSQPRTNSIPDAATKRPRGRPCKNSVPAEAPTTVATGPTTKAAPLSLAAKPVASSSCSSSLTKREQRWEDMFQLLQRYKEENPLENVDNILQVFSTPEYPGLGRWLYYVRRTWQHYIDHPSPVMPSCLTQERLDRLQSLGITPGLRPKQNLMRKPKLTPEEEDATWEVRFEELQAFKSKHGHLHVPQVPRTPLYNWLVKQRAHYVRLKNGQSNSTLTPTRMQRLTQVGFCFQTPTRKSFDERAVEWLEYRTANDGKDPINDHPGGLGAWVRKQRRKYLTLQAGGKTNLTQAQIDKLSRWGFVWKSTHKKPEKVAPPKPWKIRFGELLDFKAEHGHTIVPQLHPVLGHWVHRQRREYKKYQEGKKCSLDDGKVQQLKDIGFVFHATRRGARELQDRKSHAKMAITRKKKKNEKDSTPVNESRSSSGEAVASDSDDSEDEGPDEDTTSSSEDDDGEEHHQQHNYHPNCRSPSIGRVNHQNGITGSSGRAGVHYPRAYQGYWG